MLSKGLTLAMAIGLVASMTASVSADDDAANTRISYYKDVMPIMQQNCQICHQAKGINMGGMIAPMSFTNFQDTRPWAKSIAKVVQSKEMPPWDATEEFHGVFGNERTLTDKEIATLTRWVATGAQAGNKDDAPAPVAFSTGDWFHGTPDLVIDMPEDFLIKDEVEDQYNNFTVDITEEMLPEPRWIKSLEYRSGSEVVHHIIGYIYGGGQNAGRSDRGMVGGIAPGNEPDSFPDGYGFLVKPNSKFVFAMHYHKEKGPGTGVTDRSSVAFNFYPKEAEIKPVHIEAIGNNDFQIPAFNKRWEVGMAKTYTRPIKIMYLMPHMHLRGVAASYQAVYPDGKVEQLIDIPNYDFNWQTSYEYKEPKSIPAGTRMEVSMWFDNSAERAAEIGFNAARDIRFGGPTTDEMALGWLSYAFEDDKEVAMVAAEAAGK